MHMRIKAVLAATLMSSLAACTSLRTGEPLVIETYNPGESSIFPVSSSLIEGEHEIMLVDAQFQQNDAQELVDLIRASGKKLTTIFISHGDPDYYFGLDVVSDAFPDAVVLSSPATREYILSSMEAKNAHWGPILGSNAPEKLIVPDALQGDFLEVDSRKVQVMGLDGDDPKHTFLWIPSNRTVLGGVSVFDQQHVWMADSQTQEAREQWLQKLDDMLALHPETVIPGHYVGDSASNADAIRFTAQYITDFMAAEKLAGDSVDLTNSMIEQYPNLGGEESLKLSAKVATGEMMWP